jgi:hypothetical protein
MMAGGYLVACSPRQSRLGVGGGLKKHPADDPLEDSKLERFKYTRYMVREFEDESRPACRSGGCMTA